MTTAVVEPAGTDAGRLLGMSQAAATLTISLLGFFIITLDAVVVNVALPTIRDDLAGGISGLQWVVDGYTLMFAAFLLTSGALSDRIGARRAFGVGLTLFVIASLACGLAPSLEVLVVARFVQGLAAALMMPSSMALVRHAYAEPARRARAVGVWAMGGAVASSSGPVLGGLLTEFNWRLIFLINLPVGLVALLLLTRAPHSPVRDAPLDWVGQLTAVVAMGGLTYGAIEAGAAGLTAVPVLLAFGLSLSAVVAFVITQKRIRHPMMPPHLLANPSVRIAGVIGFAFMVGYYGLPFVVSLYLQQERGLSALATGVIFVPMMLVGAVLTPFSARIAERIGRRLLIVGGLLLMAAGLITFGMLPVTTPVGVLSAVMVLVGLGGPFVMPPTTAALLNDVGGHEAGIASGVFNTSRQVGGALAIAVFGGLLAGRDDLLLGMRSSLFIAAAVVVIAAVIALRLRKGSDDANNWQPDDVTTSTRTTASR